MAREQVKRKKAAEPAAIARGVLMRDGARVENDPWVVLDDETPAPETGDIVVSLTRFKAERDALIARAGRLGIVIAAGEAVEEIAQDVGHFALVMVQFPAFRDGRGFTTARLLRERYAYRGELRASGDVLEDQIFFMLRCGFDALEVVAAAPEAAFARAARTFSHAYQRAGDQFEPIHRLRARKREGVVVDIAAAPRNPEERAAHYARLLEGKNARHILEFAMTDLWPGKLAVVSSFGGESAVLLHMLASIDKNAPVIFLETDRHFAQTLQYRDELVERLGLTNVIDQKPEAAEAAEEDPQGDLWRRDPDACCALRKVRPLAHALEGFEAWTSGRKRFQGGLRAHLPVIEHDGAHYKVNPLAAWTAEEIAHYARTANLPAHPLVAQGFPSIGCWPCTKPADAPGRSGRWADIDKSECGIHVPAAARLQII